MLGPIVAGIGIIAGGAALGVRALHRQAVTADVAAQLKAGLAAIATTGSTATLDQLAAAYLAAKHPASHQVAIVAKAAKAGEAAHMGAAKVALYKATLASANPDQMRLVAKQLSASQPVLAANLNDVAKILGAK